MNHLNFSFTNPDYRNPKEGAPKYVIVKDIKYTQLRDWQQECFQYLLNNNQLHRFAVVQAFCGSGKTFAQVALATHDIVSTNYTQKQLIVVPQEHIHQGFIGKHQDKYICLNLNNQNYQWKILAHHNFCDGENRTRNLKNWLLTPSKTLKRNFTENLISGLNAVCSSAALTQVWQSLNNKEKQLAIKNLTLRIDEAHHIKYVFLQEEELTDNQKERIEQNSTELGRICAFIINNKETTSKLHLTTATMYRGDRETILSPAVRSKFTCYSLDWTRHFNTLGIENFNFQYEEYKKNPIDQIVKRVKAEKNQKHYIVVPARDNKWRKDDSLQELIQKLEKFIPKERILDLVTENTQQKNKALLLAEPKEEGGNSQFDVVIVCRLGREGTDWCACSRIHNASVEESVTLAIQTLGRLFRKFPDKTNVKAFHYVEKLQKPQDVTKREMLSDRTNAILVVMRLNDIAHPLINPNDIPDTEKGTNYGSNILEIAFGDQYENAQKDMIEGYELLKTKDKESIVVLAKQICKDYGVDESYTYAVATKIVRTATKDLRFKGIDIAWVRENGFDKIEFYDSLYYGDFTGLDYEAINKILTNRHGKNFLSYADAQAIVCRLNLKNQKGWNSYCQANLKPRNIPRSPAQYYAGLGWTTWSNFLGNDRNRVEYLNYNQASELAIKNNIKTSSEYQYWTNRPKNLPSNPNRHYKNQWINWANFLGKEFINLVPYEKAREIVQLNKIKSESQYRNWKDKPACLPFDPRQTYKNKGWISWFDFANKEKPIDFIQYNKAQRIVKKANIVTQKEYYGWENRPKNLPACPQDVYNEWTNWADFLGKESINLVSYEKAQKIVKQHGIKTSTEYRNWHNRPKNIPGCPGQTYKNKGWIAWYHFLGNKKPAEFMTYHEAQKIVKKFKIDTQQKYCQWKERPNNLPSNPSSYYSQCWNGWSDFLGNGRRTRIKKENCFDFNTARNITVQFNIKTNKQYKGWKDRPGNLPAHPEDIYKNEWKGWAHFLGKTS